MPADEPWKRHACGRQSGYSIGTVFHRHGGRYAPPIRLSTDGVADAHAVHEAEHGLYVRPDTQIDDLLRKL